MNTGAGPVLARARAVLFDFDGPVCSLFAGLPADRVAEQLRTLLPRDPWPDDLDQDDPLDSLRRAVHFGAATVLHLEEELTRAEVAAAAVAAPTAGGSDSLQSCVDSGRLCAIVTNNSAAAASTYLRAHDLDHLVQVVAGRAVGQPHLMKPDPDVIHRAIAALRVPAADVVVVGDSVGDLVAAHAAGARCIGYANRPGKYRTLAHADAMVDDMTVVAEQLRTHPWPAG